MIFDTHIHLNDERLINNLDEYLSDARILGITDFLCVGWDIESSKKAIELAHKFNGVYAAIALMPTEWKQYNKETISELRELAKDNLVVAIGEIGLDYYWEKTDEIKAIQKEMFIGQIKLANELNLPVSIHCRDAYQDCLDVVKSFHVKRKSVMHCYSGSLEMGLEFIRNNFVLAFGGTLTFKNSKNAQNVFLNIDIDSIVFETDAPYLAPQKFRGQMNIPKYIYETILFASSLRNMNFEDFQKQIYKNSKEIFSRENI